MKILLAPISWLYAIVLHIRHKLFDWGILKSKSFSVPTICVGNLALGGTGKTPHTEYLIRILKDQFNVAVLSRGYGRKTKGYVLAKPDTGYEEIGDEPLLYHSKFNDINVVVDENRCEGVENLMASAPDTDVILLDDAYQHRKIRQRPLSSRGGHQPITLIHPVIQVICHKQFKRNMILTAW